MAAKSKYVYVPRRNRRGMKETATTVFLLLVGVGATLLMMLLNLLAK